MQPSAKYYPIPQRESSVWEKYQIAETLSRFPSLTLKVLFRRKVGLRRAQPSHLILMAVILFFMSFCVSLFEGVCSALSSLPLVNMFFSYNVRPHLHLLPYFAALMLIAGLWQYHGRWRELRTGECWHTYSDGISPFEDALWSIMPPSQGILSASPKFLSRDWWLSESRITRFIDPLALFAAGWFLDPVDWSLSLWIMFAAACLAIDESLTWQSQLKIYLDWNDNLINAESMKQLRSSAPGKRGGVSSHRNRNGLPVPTGIGEDIRRQIDVQTEASRPQIRARESRQTDDHMLTAPDNLAGSHRISRSA